MKKIQPGTNKERDSQYDGVVREGQVRGVTSVLVENSFRVNEQEKHF